MTRNDGDWLTETLARLTDDGDGPLRLAFDRSAPEQGEPPSTRRRTAVSLVAVVVVGAAVLVRDQPTPGAWPQGRARHRRPLGVSDRTAAKGRPRPTASPPRRSAAGNGENGFALSLLRQLNASGSGGPDLVTSPSSLATVLSMLELVRGVRRPRRSPPRSARRISPAPAGRCLACTRTDELEAATRAGIDLDGHQPRMQKVCR